MDEMHSRWRMSRCLSRREMVSPVDGDDRRLLGGLDVDDSERRSCLRIFAVAPRAGPKADQAPTRLESQHQWHKMNTVVMYSPDLLEQESSSDLGSLETNSYGTSLLFSSHDGPLSRSTAQTGRCESPSGTVQPIMPKREPTRINSQMSRQVEQFLKLPTPKLLQDQSKNRYDSPAAGTHEMVSKVRKICLQRCYESRLRAPEPLQIDQRGASHSSLRAVDKLDRESPESPSRSEVTSYDTVTQVGLLPNRTNPMGYSSAGSIDNSDRQWQAGNKSSQTSSIHRVVRKWKRLAADQDKITRTTMLSNQEGLYTRRPHRQYKDCTKFPSENFAIRSVKSSVAKENQGSKRLREASPGPAAPPSPRVPPGRKPKHKSRPNEDTKGAEGNRIRKGIPKCITILTIQTEAEQASI